MERVKNKKTIMGGLCAIIALVIMLPCMLFLTACGGVEDGIEIQTKFKTTYYVEEELDVTGGILNYTNDGKTIQVAITKDMITGFSTQTAGTRSLVITYEDYTKTISYTVKDYPEFVENSCVYTSAEQATGHYFFLKFEQNNKVYLAEDTSQDWRASNYLGWTTDQHYVICFTYTKEFVNDKWEVNASFDTGSGTVTLSMTNISKDSFTLRLVGTDGRVQSGIVVRKVVA